MQLEWFELFVACCVSAPLKRTCAGLQVFLGTLTECTYKPVRDQEKAYTKTFRSSVFFCGEDRNYY